MRTFYTQSPLQEWLEDSLNRTQEIDLSTEMRKSLTASHLKIPSPPTFSLSPLTSEGENLKFFYFIA